MVTRAYVTSKIYDDNGAKKCKINVPIFGASMEYEVLREKNERGLEAIIACSPNENPQFKEGDAVIVAFEEYLADSPIIIGWLFGSKDDRGKGTIYSTYPSSVFEDVTVGASLRVPKKIKYIDKLNEIKYSGKKAYDYTSSDTKEIDLSMLNGLTDVIQNQLDNLNKKADDIDSKVKDLSNFVDTLVKTLEQSGVITNGYYSSANYSTKADNEPINSLPSDVTKSESIIIPGN